MYVIIPHTPWYPEGVLAGLVEMLLPLEGEVSQK